MKGFRTQSKYFVARKDHDVADDQFWLRTRVGRGRTVKKFGARPPLSYRALQLSRKVSNLGNSMRWRTRHLACLHLPSGTRKLRASQLNFAAHPLLSLLRPLIPSRDSRLCDSAWRRNPPSGLSHPPIKTVEASSFAVQSRGATAVRLAAPSKLSRKVLKLPGSICAQDNVCAFLRQSNSL